MSSYLLLTIFAQLFQIPVIAATTNYQRNPFSASGSDQESPHIENDLIKDATNDSSSKSFIRRPKITKIAGIDNALVSNIPVSKIGDKWSLRSIGFGTIPYFSLASVINGKYTEALIILSSMSLDLFKGNKEVLINLSIPDISASLFDKRSSYHFKNFEFRINSYLAIFPVTVLYFAIDPMNVIKMLFGMSVQNNKMTEHPLPISMNIRPEIIYTTTNWIIRLSFNVLDIISERLKSKDTINPEIPIFTVAAIAQAVINNYPELISNTIAKKALFASPSVITLGTIICLLWKHSYSPILMNSSLDSITYFPNSTISISRKLKS